MGKRHAFVVLASDVSRVFFFGPRPLTLSQLTLTSGNFMSKHFQLWENAKTLSSQSKYNTAGHVVKFIDDITDFTFKYIMYLQHLTRHS